MILIVLGRDDSRRDFVCTSLQDFMTDNYKGGEVEVVMNVSWDYFSAERKKIAGWPSDKLLVLSCNPVFFDVLNDFSNISVSEVLSSTGRVPPSLQRHVVRERLNQMVANLRSIGKRVYIVNSAD